MEVALARQRPGRTSWKFPGVEHFVNGYRPQVSIRRQPEVSPALSTPLDVSRLADRSAQLGLAALDDCVEESLTTPFEDWCEATGTHPEALGAWERFTQRASAG